MRTNSFETRAAIVRAVVEALETRCLFNFAAPAAYPAGPWPQPVTTGDFNGDGHSDVVYGNAGANGVNVRLSNANGTLQAAQHFAGGSDPRSIAIGDVNNDGKRDIVTANSGGDLSVLLGNGNGTFQPALTAALPAQFPPGYTGLAPVPQTPGSVVMGDLNGDGKLDLVVGANAGWTPYPGYYYSQAYVNVLVGNGNGTFGNANAYASLYGSTVALGDFNGDNKLDVLSSTSVSFWAGNGNGTLQPYVYINTYASDEIVGDFNGDGKLDFVGNNGSGLLLSKGQGNGTFATAVSVFNERVRSVVAGDVNGDGKLDLVVSTQATTYEYYGYYGGYNPTTTDSTKVLLGYGDGTFARPITTTLGSHPDLGTGNSSALGDFNADGAPDLVATDRLPAEYSNSTLSVQLNEAPWVLPATVTITDATVTEGHSGTVNAVFTVTVANAPAGANVTVNYSTADGTATAAGGDYVATSGTLTFAPGQTSKTITVAVKGDRIGEADEAFYVNLTNGVNADLVDGQGLGTITDDEPRVSISNASVTEGNSGTTPMTFTVTLSAASAVPSTVAFATASGTAIAGRDFDAASGTLTFAAGQTSKTISVAVRGDVIDEYDETFSVALSGTANAYAVSAGTGTILDNDAPPAMVISDVSRGEGNAGTTPFTFTISLSAPSEKDVQVRWATASGSATSSTQGGKQDYQPDGYYGLYFYPSQQSATVTVNVIGDTRSESDETFFVNLSEPFNATIADAQGVGTILNDEGGRGKTWVGPSSGGSWATAANWSPSGVPDATSLVTIAGAAVTLSSAATVSEVTLNNGASLSVATNGNRVFRTAGLFLDGTSKLNLNDNDLIVDYIAGSSPIGLWDGGVYAHYYQGITGLVAQGSNGGAWNGAGIITTRPDAVAGRTTLAVAEASAVRGLTGAQTALFSGQTVDATTVLVKYTYAGDATLDGVINIDDYTQIDSSVSAGGTSNGLFNGDFNYDGEVNIDDYTVIDSNAAIQGPAL